MACVWSAMAMGQLAPCMGLAVLLPWGAHTSSELDTQVLADAAHCWMGFLLGSVTLARIQSIKNLFGETRFFELTEPMLHPV